MPTASFGMRIRSKTLHCSQMSSAVMILVVLAIRARAAGSLSKRYLPVTGSNATA